MTIKIKMSEVDNFFQGEYGNLFEKDSKMSVSDEQVGILMGEMNSTMYDILFGLGFYVDEKYLVWDSSSYDKIDWWLDLVYECYEGQLSETNLWNDYFGFGGDDDVDYNSSYIFIVNEFMKWMNDRNLLENYGVAK